MVAILLFLFLSVVAAWALCQVFKLHLGLSLIVAFLAPGFVWFLGNGFGVSLSDLSQGYVVSVIVAVALILAKQRGTVLSTSRDFFAKSLWQLWLPIGLMYLVSLTWGGRDYPDQWDEFSHWYMMPKQFLAQNSLTSIEIPFKKFVSYTPGWTSILAFPYALVGESFNETTAYWVAILLTLSVMILVSEAIVETTRLTGAYTYLAGILLVTLALGAVPWPMHGLVEPPIYVVAIAVLVILFGTYWSTIKKWTVLTFLLIMGFLIKKSLVILAVPVALYFLSEKRMSWRSRLIYVISSCLLVVAVTYFWKFQTSQFLEIWQVRESLSEAMLNRPAVVSGFFKALLKHFLRDLPTQALMFYGFYLAWKHGDRRAVWIPWVTITVYLGSMLYMYLVSFDLNEAMQLKSFNRYASVLSFPLRALGLLLFLRYLPWQLPSLFERLSVRFFKIAAILAVLIIFSLNAVYNVDPKPTEFKQHAQLIQEHFSEIKQPQGVAITSFTSRAFWCLNYESIIGGVSRYSIHSNFKEVDAVRDGEIDEMLNQYDFVWMRGKLTGAYVKLCNSPEGDFFLYKKDGKTLCHCNWTKSSQ